MKVLITSNIPETGIKMLKNEGIQVEIWRQDQPMTPQELVKKCQDFQALLTTGMDSINKGFLQKCTHLNIISQFGAGYDNIDEIEARKLGIAVGNAPDAMTDATADIAFVLMLAASRKICHLHKSIVANEWGFFNPRAHLGLELKGLTLGIFGMGRIGFEMAKRCQGAYQMKIIYCSRSEKPSVEQHFGAIKVCFDELLEQSDILSVHCALNDQTRGIFNKAAFHKMKKSALFINTSRGQVHQQNDLYEALVGGTIWGAGLDVTNPEPMRPDDPLLHLENVAITPHIGSATMQARDEMSRQAAQNIVQYYRGNKVENLVN